jgi:hypothetical protein
VREIQLTANAKTLGVGGRSSLADAALSTILRAVLAILTILASTARIGSGASRRENVKRDLIEQQNRQHDLSRE